MTDIVAAPAASSPAKTAKKKKLPGADVAAKAEASRKKRPQPYPGLNYYLPGQADLFAGRYDEVTACVNALFDSRVLVLHGPTGCGKSSFLRAGVKPRIAEAGVEAGFVGGPDQFEVIRSTARPLYQFVRHIEMMAKGVASGEKKYGRPKPGADVSALLAQFSSVDRMARKPSAAFAAYRALLAALETTPILVIDQGEEIFTLNDERRVRADAQRRAERDASKEGRKFDRDEFNRDFEKEIENAKEETNAYFSFLRRIVQDGGGPIVVSLRTEYKGQFDDKIAGSTGHPGAWLKGFYLDPLGKDALVAAIRRPTLDQAEWDELRVSERLRAKEPPWTGEGFRLVFPEDEASYLAGELLKGDAVPPGGILPALQIACRRLYDQALGGAGEVKHVIVSRSSIKRLGAIANQVEEYVSESIEEACSVWKFHGKRHRAEFGELIDLVHRALATTLVMVEPDGRAVTRHRRPDAFMDELRSTFGSSLFAGEIEELLDFLRDKGVLRNKSSSESADDDPRWSLGHDSIALALHKWRLVFVRDGGTMRMMMSGAEPKDYEMKDLYPDGSRPPPMTIVVPKDFLWDRQLPLFAHEKGFDTRLGFNIELGDELDATKIGTGPETWLDLVSRACALEDRRRDDRTKDVLVAAEWGAFPLIQRDEENDKPECDDWYDDKRVPRPSEYARQWTDVAATNMNLGNGLIGPIIAGLERASKAEQVDEEQRAEAIRTSIRNTLNHLISTKPEPRLWVFDLPAQRLIELAADLAYKSNSEELRQARAWIARCAKKPPEDKYSARDPIVARLLQSQDQQAKQEARSGRGGRADEVRSQFAVASAFPRAMAAQSGFRVYFDARHVAALARYEMEQRKRDPDDVPEYGASVRDMAAAMQRIISNTLWTLSVPNAQWDFGSHRAEVLRLASLAYYTTEYARTSMDEYVAFLQRFSNGFLASNPPGEDSLRAVRLSRKEVRQAVRECFNFVRFEEFGKEVFDLDTPHAYWSDHGAVGSKSVAVLIYQELLALRQQTLRHFQEIVGAISWLRYKDAYFPKLDDEVRSAFLDKQRAWRHFSILNFYDAERFMGRAADTLARRLDDVLSDEDLPNWRNTDTAVRGGSSAKLD